MRQKQSAEHRLTASEQCKSARLKSLAELAAMVRKPTQTLRNWHRDAPELFAIVVAGAVVIKAANAKSEPTCAAFRAGRLD